MYSTTQNHIDAAKRLLAVMQERTPDLYRLFVHYDLEVASSRGGGKSVYTPFVALFSVEPTLYKTVVMSVVDEFEIMKGVNLDPDDVAALAGEYAKHGMENIEIRT